MSRKVALSTLILVVFSFFAVVGTTYAGDALYVWRDPDPSRNGTPIDLAEAQRLADFAVAEGISTIYYDNFGCGSDLSCPPGAEQQDSSTLAPIIALLHSHGLQVEALYTDNTRILDVVNYNNAVQLNERFDAIRLDTECHPPFIICPFGEFSEPTTAANLDFYTQAVAVAGVLPVYVSIGHHWDNLYSVTVQITVLGC